MKRTRHPVPAWNNNGLILALAGALLSLSSAGFARADDKAFAAGRATGIEVSFKVDTRLTKGLYMGDRWVSSPTYTGTAGQDTVDARSHGLDARGTPVAISADWIPSDPEMVTVSPEQGKEVRITVKRSGESKLQVTSQGVTKELAIKAVAKGGALQVEIAQLGTAGQPAEGASPLKSEQQKSSYALGMSLGSQFRQQALELELDLYMQGLKDALSGGKTLLTETEARVLMANLQSALTRKGASQAEKNKKDGEAFLAENKSREGVVTLQSGLQYKVLKAGDGQKPALDATVVCHYRGTLIDGTEFDSSYKRSNQPATFPVKGVIKGWNEALQLMPVGSKWQLFIPSNLAYGARAAGGKIAPHSTLIFEIELIAIKEAPAGDDQASK